MILLRAEIRTFVIYCMTEAIFCVPCISFGTSECSKRLRRELAFATLSPWASGGFSAFPCGTGASGPPVLPTSTFQVSPNLRGEGSGVLASILEKLSRSIQDQHLEKDRTQHSPFVVTVVQQEFTPAFGQYLLRPHLVLTQRMDPLLSRASVELGGFQEQCPHFLPVEIPGAPPGPGSFCSPPGLF